MVTNRHVIEGAAEVRVILPDGSSLPAKSTYVGAQIDLALLKISAGRPLPALRLGDSDGVQIGDPVAAIGNPLMRGGSVSAGIVTGLTSKSPAGRAGLADGDVIMKVGERELTDSRALARLTVQAQPGETISLTVWRDGRPLVLPVTVAEWTDHPMREVGGEREDVVTVRPDTTDYGLRFAPITEDTRRRLKLEPGQKGAVVTEAGLNSPAADGGFHAGDVVLRVQMAAVATPAEAKRELDGAIRARRPVIILLVQRPDGLCWSPARGQLRPGLTAGARPAGPLRPARGCATAQA